MSNVGYGLSNITVVNVLEMIFFTISFGQFLVGILVLCDIVRAMDSR